MSGTTGALVPARDALLGGRTGDIDGNLDKVKRELRRIRFPVDFDGGAAREGDPMALLPALHYALLGFSRHVTNSLGEAGHDLQAKSDARFVEGAWRALREEFGYNPALTPQRFLSPGFAERKLMLLHDTIELCKRRHNEHARRKRAEETAAAVNREGVPRVARAVAEKRGAEAREGRDAETAGRNRARFSASSVGRAPSAFAITRHAGGVPGGEAHTDTGGRARGEDHQTVRDIPAALSGGLKDRIAEELASAKELSERPNDDEDPRVAQRVGEAIER